MSRVGLAAMRLQPLHKGHTRLIGRMIEDCETAIVGVGSAQVSRTRSNPFTIEERIKMLKNVYGERIKIVPLTDLGATEGTNDWIDYVLQKLKGLGLPDPTDYYSGSVADALWYRERFYAHGLSPENNYIPNPDPASQFANLDAYRVSPIHDRRHLHIIDRDGVLAPAATDIRTFIELGNDQWKRWVPAVNHEIVATSYPDEYKVGVKKATKSSQSKKG